MLNNLTIIIQNFVKTFRKMTQLLIVEFLVLKTTISNIAIHASLFKSTLLITMTSS